jgi:peptide/nickel transport system substrate-binding protein
LYLPKETVLTAADDSTVEFRSPTPIGNFPAALASQYFLLHKPDGTQSMCTGQYRPTQFTKDTEVTFSAFDGHWAGKPLLQSLTVKLVADSNTRSLALQSGDVDMVYGLSPEALKSLDNSSFSTVSIPSTRVHFLMLNHLKPPFDDVAVAQATSLGIDRQSLLQAALDGQGVALTSIFPPNQGVDVLPYYTVDVDRARTMLDTAGWSAGPSGVREKAGQRLAFTLYSYPGRAELTPMAIAIQGQLKPLGYDIQVQEVRDITAQTPVNGAWQIAMNSNDSQSNGDPQRLLAQSLVSTGIDNRGGWKNIDFDAAYDSLRTESDAAKRQAALRTVQELATSNMANIYLVAGPIIAAFKKGRVAGYTPHPIDLYTVDRDLTVNG